LALKRSEWSSLHGRPEGWTKMAPTDHFDEEELLASPEAYECFGGGEAEFHAAYEELEQLGRGEFGVVKRAFHRRTGHQVAVKHLPKTPKSQEELEVVCQMRHDNVARLLIYFESDQELLLVLELCDMGLLSEYLAKQPEGRALRGERECAALMQQLLSGISHCHGMGFVHNDLKFDNIMLASGIGGPKLKLIDFGNACAQKEGAKKPADDMWFAGLIFFQLITGLPFFLMDSDELESLDEQGVYVDPQRMLCDDFYLQLRLSVAKRFADSIAMDLLVKMLQLDKKSRISAADALDHPFLLPVKQEKPRDEKGRKGSLESVGYASTAATMVV